MEVGTFDGDSEYPYTVGPPAKVVAFFNDCVFVKTYTKHVPIGADMKIQVSIEDDENAGPSTRQIDCKHEIVVCTCLHFFNTQIIVTENAPTDKSGKAKKVKLPIGIESVNQYKKALMALHDYQFETRRIVWPSPKVCKEVKNIIKQYGERLKYDQVQTHADRAAHCIIRDSYKIGQLTRILLDLWCSNDRFHMRERFSIAARHHMLLRDQDLRNLNFSDCFSTIISRTQHRGVQQAVALLFCLDKVKTLKDGEVKFACAMRHYNLYRCPFSAFAFYLFSKLQVRNIQRLFAMLIV